MRKVAIFTEGQGEQIFVCELLLRVVSYEVALSIECLQLRAGNFQKARPNYPNPNSTVHYLIVDVGNDEKVLSAISERHENFISIGYDVIIGLRDMYSDAYRRRSSSKIDDSVTNSFISKHNETIQGMSNPDKIFIFFAIMELESWLLSMYRLLERFNPTLNCEHIERELGFDLSKINPETKFFHPAKHLANILALAGKRYKKSKDHMESILSNMIREDIDDALEEGRCSQSFDLFLSKIRSVS